MGRVGVFGGGGVGGREQGVGEGGVAHFQLFGGISPHPTSNYIYI